jgi:type IV pilus assembly protein PilV
MKTHTGFTLIEVLIAMLVLAVGLLGMAGLQTYTLRTNLAAYTHGQATQLLYDMADRMRANSRVLDNTNPNKPQVIANTLLVNYLIADSSTDARTAGKTVSVTDPCRTAGTTCTRANMIVYDLVEWHSAIAATLPMGRGCIASPDNVVFYLYVTWDENRSGTVTTDGSGTINSAVPTGCNGFSTYVAPTSDTSHDPIFSVSLQL